MNKFLAGNCYFTVYCSTAYSFRLSLDPSGLPPMGREDKKQEINVDVHQNAILQNKNPHNQIKLYNVYVRNKVTSRYEHIGQVKLEYNKLYYTWWKPLEWLQAKVMFQQGLNGKLPVRFADRCCRCGKRISHENAARGYGPECAKYFEGGDDN